MPSCKFANFDITIRGAQTPYSVTAQFEHQVAEGLFTQDVRQPAWQAHIRRMERSLYTPDDTACEEAGRLLFRALVHADIRDLWMYARAQLETGHTNGLRLRFSLQPPGVAALPWESLFDPDRNLAYAAHESTPLVRVENLLRYVGKPRPLRVDLPFKILIAAPDDPSGEIDVEQELDAVVAELSGIDAKRIAISTLRGRFGILDLRRKLKEHTPDFLHVISHGSQTAIQLWQSGRPRLVPAAALKSTIERAESVKLVLLNACLSGLGADDVSFSSVGAYLLQAGVPAVIAMQFPIRDDAAIHFSSLLYEELIAGRCPGAIDLAVASARSGLYALNPGDISYGTPILWLNAQDGQIFATDDDGFQSETPGSPPIDRIAIDAERRWLEHEDASVDLSRVPAALRFLVLDWHAALRDLRLMLDQLQYLEERGMHVRYAAKLNQYREAKQQLVRLRHKLEDAISHSDR